MEAKLTWIINFKTRLLKANGRIIHSLSIGVRIGLIEQGVSEVKQVSKLVLCMLSMYTWQESPCVQSNSVFRHLTYCDYYLT